MGADEGGSVGEDGGVGERVELMYHGLLHNLNNAN